MLRETNLRPITRGNLVVYPPSRHRLPRRGDSWKKKNKKIISKQPHAVRLEASWLEFAARVWEGR